MESATVRDRPTGARGTTPAPPEAVVTLDRDLAGLPLDPVAVLREASSPRGAWDRGGEWCALGGCAAAVRVDAGEGDRFAALRAAAATVEAAGSEDLRWFGGLSFHGDHAGAAPWRGFPAAEFVLPAWEVWGRGDEGRRLLVRRPVRGEGDESAALREAERSLARAERRLAGGLAEDGGGVSPAAEPLRVAGRNGAGRAAWERGVESALERIRDGSLEKVVLARELEIRTARPPDPLAAYRRVRSEGGGAAAFLWQPSAGGAFLGSSPELLASMRGGEFRATAVAGSIRRGADPAEDEALGERLLANDKDRREHSIVAEEIRRCLAPRCRRVVVEPPRLLRLPRIQHLESPVRGLEPSDPHVLALLGAVHPTPAVCGRPREEALRFLRDIEPFERGWYAGPIGWFDAAGAGEFVPGLRSALAGKDGWRLFAGAGIVEGSDPEREWEETGMKFRPMLSAVTGSGRRGEA